VTHSRVLVPKIPAAAQRVHLQSHLRAGTEIARLARRHGVRRLEVFGSILRDDFDESSSDIDIVVEFEPKTGGGGFRQYFNLKASLESLMGRRADLVELSAMEDTRLKRIIERSKIPIYAAPA
jgi:predicted nucleotidyltransferase